MLLRMLSLKTLPCYSNSHRNRTCSNWKNLGFCAILRPFNLQLDESIPFWIWFEFVWSMLLAGIVDDDEDDVAIVAAIVFGEVVSILTMVEAAAARWCWLCATDDDDDWFDWKCPKLFDVVISDTWHGSRFICTPAKKKKEDRERGKVKNENRKVVCVLLAICFFFFFFGYFSEMKTHL